jgi:hypothetical protein
MAMDTKLMTRVSDIHRQLFAISTGKVTSDMSERIRLSFPVRFHHLRIILASELQDISTRDCYPRGSLVDKSE